MQLLIKAAQLVGQSRPVAVWCDGGRIAGISDDEGHVPAGPFDRTIDLAGQLLLPAFINPHLHPDKSLLGDRLSFPGATLEDAVKPTWDFKRSATEDEIASR